MWVYDVYDMAIHGLKSRTARGFTSKLFIQSRGTAKNLNSGISSALVVTDHKYMPPSLMDLHKCLA